MKRLFFAGCCLLLAGLAAQAVVDIGDIGVGARPLGMGKACIGGIDDASAIFTNPAALDQNPNLNIISMSGNLMGDVSYILVGAAESAPIGRFGIGYVNAAVGGIPITEITGSGSTAAVTQVGVSDYSSSIIYFTYGSNLGRFLRGRIDNISLGGSLKYFLQGFSGGGSSMQGANGSGMDVDLGVLWDINSWSALGLTLNNCLPMAFGGKFTWQKNGVEESIPYAARLGGSFKLLGPAGMRASDSQALSLKLDYESGRGENRPTVWHTGLEYWPVDALAFRLGIDQKPRATETGTSVDSNLTAGVGIKFSGFTFDYAYHQFGDLTENTTHFFSFGYRGPEKKIVEEAIREKLKKEGAIPLAEVARKPELIKFSDIPEEYWAKGPIQYLATLGVMGGYPDGTFKPDKALTRGELAALLVKAKGFEVKGAEKKVFKDIKTTDWLAPYVEIAVNRGYVKGYPNKTFRPNQKITRAEAAVVLAKYTGVYVKPKLEEKPFPDMRKDHWASPSVAAIKGEGMLDYLGGRDFEPNTDLSRAEAAEILSKTALIKQKIKSFLSGEEVK
ncbi:MAG: S-layer homology domain-containing protein [Candidatus Margulisbacteria bacterium]|nr:S-layer homology domain-containing protein [Candidatus Margulisiibacteriota bacterium]